MATNKGILSDLFNYIKSKKLWLNVALIIITFFVLVWLLSLWLDSYTRHGQELMMPDYTDKPIELAREDASDRTFEIKVIDSVFLAGEKGGIITQQNPKGGSKVKEGRTIYVTITKYAAEKLSVTALPRLYGENFEIKKKELKVGYNLESEVVGESYDPGPEGHIMAVIYEGDTIITADRRRGDRTIEKGETLKFILSKQEGGYFPLPDLVCKKLQEARFQLDALRLQVGEVQVMGATSDVEDAYVISQEPPYSENAKIQIGDSVNVVVSPLKPEDCE
jgi:beta-lactam-binding protein with PASTA domain